MTQERTRPTVKLKLREQKNTLMNETTSIPNKILSKLDNKSDNITSKSDNISKFEKNYTKHYECQYCHYIFTDMSNLYRHCKSRVEKDQILRHP